MWRAGWLPSRVRGPVYSGSAGAAAGHRRREVGGGLVAVGEERRHRGLEGPTRRRRGTLSAWW